MQFTTLFLTAAVAGSALAGSPDAWGPPNAWGPPAPPAYGHGSGGWPVTSAVSVAPPPPYVTPSPPVPPVVSVHSLPPYKSYSWASSKKHSSASGSAYSSASKPPAPIATSTSTPTTVSPPIVSSTGGANSLAQNGVAALAFLGAAAAFAL